MHFTNTNTMSSVSKITPLPKTSQVIALFCWKEALPLTALVETQTQGHMHMHLWLHTQQDQLSSAPQPWWTSHILVTKEGTHNAMVLTSQIQHTFKRLSASRQFALEFYYWIWVRVHTKIMLKRPHFLHQKVVQLPAKLRKTSFPVAWTTEVFFFVAP